MATISVIVPVYKVERYIRQCVDSILFQSFHDFDLVLVDDGSPDNCPAICDSYAEADRRITVLHKKNGGLSDARNAGIDWAMEHSDSDWLSFVDSDDYLHPDFLLTLYNSAIKESADLAVCDFFRVDDTGALLGDKHSFFELSTEDKGVLFDCLKSNWRIDPAWNKLYAKRIFESLRFSYRKIHEDEFAIHHVLWNCGKAVILRDQLYYYRCRQNSITAEESPSSKLDGFEALILQYEFCNTHSLPVRRHDIYYDCLKSVVALKQKFSKAERLRFRQLKHRYTKAYFDNKTNHSFNGVIRFFLFRPYRKLLHVFKFSAKKGSQS